MIKKLSFLASLLLIIGVIGSIATFSSVNNEIITSNETQHILNDKITSIQIDVESTDVEFIPVQRMDKARIELVSENGETLKEHFAVEDEGETLLISQQSKNEKWFNFNPFMQSRTLKIYAPEKMYNTLNINGVSTDIFLQNVEAKSMNISTVSGDIEGENINAEGSVIETVSGDIQLENIQGEMKTVTASGDVFMSMTEISESVNVKTTSGDIDITSIKEPSDVTFDVSTSAGDINLFDKYNSDAKIGKGTIIIQLETSSGDITATNE